MLVISLLVIELDVVMYFISCMHGQLHVSWILRMYIGGKRGWGNILINCLMKIVCTKLTKMQKTLTLLTYWVRVRIRGEMRMMQKVKVNMKQKKLYPRKRKITHHQKLYLESANGKLIVGTLTPNSSQRLPNLKRVGEENVSVKRKRPEG